MYGFMFPGQGSQSVGMGKAIAEQYAEAKEVFEEVDSILNYRLSDVIFSGPDDKLNLTENTQPALMAVSMAVFRVLEKQKGFSLKDHAALVAGHSLGEYSALTAAGALKLEDTARLLQLRGQAMQRAVPLGEGSMAAILGLSFEEVQAIAEEASSTEVCAAANDNSVGQVVISGHKAAVEQAITLAQEKGAKRAVALPVSAPFHCALMAPAAEEMKAALQDVDIQAPVVPVVCNVTAKAESDPEVIRKLLVDQITGIVRWRESVLYMKEQGVTHLTEIGAGKVLCGLVRRIDRDIQTQNIESPEDIEAFSL